VKSAGNYDYEDGTGVQVNAFKSGDLDQCRVVVIQNKIHNDLDVQVRFPSPLFSVSCVLRVATLFCRVRNSTGDV